MTIWTEILDQIVARAGAPPAGIALMRIPPIDGWEPGRVWGTWKVDPGTFHGGGAVFGGWLAAMADSFVGLAMFSTLRDDETFSTSDLRVSFFRPVTRGTLECVAEVLHRGRRMAHVEAVMVGEDQKVVAKATATQVLLPFAGFARPGEDDADRVADETAAEGGEPSRVAGEAGPGE